VLLIGVFARLGGTTAKTLRHYDERGIFHPAWVDPGSGYRYYSPTQLPELRRIIALRDVGVPLADVAGLIAEGADLRPVLQRRREELEETRAAIDGDLRALDIWVASAEAGPEVVVRQVESQLIAGLRTELPPGKDVGPLFYELERAVQDAGSRAPLPPGLVTARHPGDRRFVEVFVPVTRAVVVGRVATRRLPGSKVAATLHRGSYEGMPAARVALEEWVFGAGHVPGDEIRILYLSFGAEPELGLPDAYLADGSHEYVTEIQVPLVE